MQCSRSHWLELAVMFFNLRRPVLNVEIFEGQNIYGYNFDKSTIFLKITVAVPRLVAAGKWESYLSCTGLITSLLSLQVNERLKWDRSNVKSSRIRRRCHSKATSILKQGGFFVYYNTEGHNLTLSCRFMVDAGVAGCCWFELPPTKYRIRERSNKLSSYCQIEVSSCLIAVRLKIFLDWVCV